MQWWARADLAVCRAVILMNRLLDDPSNFYSYSRLYASSVAAILAWGFRATTLDSFWYKDVSAMIEKVKFFIMMHLFLVV